MMARLDSAAEGSDYRVYVFAAYGAVVVILFLYCIWLTALTARAEKKLDHLRERLGPEKPPETKL